jgi:hypothetical protein
MRPRPISVLSVLLFIAAVTIGAYVLNAARIEPRSALASAGPTVQQIQELADLIVLRVQVADVLEGEHSRGAKMAVLVRGDCDLTIDLSRARIVEKDVKRRTAQLALPAPHPLRPRVDHERTRIYRTERTTIIPWRDPRDRLYEEAMARAQELVEQACADERSIVRAKHHAEGLIRAFYRELGWTVGVAWKSS